MGRPAKNLTNQKFGRLTALQRDASKPSGAGKSAYWICQCDCGNICSIRQDKLTKEITQSCGCLSKEVRTEIFLKDLAGQRFGKLIVIDRDTTVPMGKGYFAQWNCICDCGNKVSVRGDHLRNGTTQSCGCINSQGELKLSQILMENNILFKKEYSFQDLTGENGHLLRFDFAIMNSDNSLVCLIEYQGEQHYKPYHFDTQERFEKRQAYDVLKREYCKEHDIKLIEVPYTDYNALSLEYLVKKGMIIE